MGTGATLIVVDHDADLIRSADRVLDLGPGGDPTADASPPKAPLEGLRGASHAEHVPL
ncbi:hypothetical protein [Streptomyces lavendofoliae]|uniref:hypothetical protein n=1 Tax=Streptomyces lavendofoliae TaxID=67314 RepID=UPI0016762B5F|nr:hypothetical protein [Streptomyces lavendofoliae]